MPKKCESCQNFRPDWRNRGFEAGACISRKIVTMNSLPILTARGLCDKEGDGIFVYFEPKTPAAGVAFAKAA